MNAQLKILTYNICALPNWLNQFSNPKKRIDKIISFIIKINADIICIQEAFDKKIVIKLISELPNYYYCHYPIKSNITVNSGLIIFSKYHILSRGFEKFKNSCGEDRLAKKGIIYIKVKIKGKIYTIINSHLNADAIFSSVSYSQKVRMKQIQQVLHRMTQYRNNVILCGDFNIHLYDPCAKHILDEITTFKKYCIKSKKMITFKEENKQLDYIFYLSNNKILGKHSYKVFNSTFNVKNIKTNKYELLDMNIISDHYPLLFTLNYNTNSKK